MDRNNRFAELVRLELDEARDAHSDLHSAHEAWAVICEELEEFKAEVFRHQEDRDVGRMLRELVQTAAMCQRTAEDLGLIA
jgi:hypothetical protein